MIPSLGSINFLEQLTELRKTHLLTRLPIYYKRMLKNMNQQPDEAIHRARFQTKKLCPRGAQGMARWHSEAFCFPDVKRGRKAVLLGLYGGFITQSWLTKSWANDDLFNPQPLSPPQKSEGRTENSYPLITRLVLQATSRLPCVLLNITSFT